MRKTTNYGLTLYDKDDKMAITPAENSLNANMEIIDSKLKEKASTEDVANYIEEHKEELKGEPGEAGKDGTNGYTPIRGTDYYTEADKQEMVNLVLEALPSAEEVSF